MSLSAIVSGSTGGSTTAGFDPSRHGFGFRNWSSQTQDFEVPDADPSDDRVRERLRSGWRGPAASVLGLRLTAVPDALLDALTDQLRGSLLQRAGTNGHCYGMGLAAQRYFERPATLPLELATASEVQHPAAPLEEPDAPVYREIVGLQADQFLRFRAWLGRRAMLWPDRIDVDAQLRDVRAVIDTFGTATVSLLESQLSGHQVLAYDYDDHADGTTLSVYDPNHRAELYDRQRRTIEFERTERGLSMRPYGRYTRFLFNRYDRIEDATGREDASPLDHTDLGATEVRESLFPMALVTVDSEDVDLAVSTPGGGRLGRTRGAFMDRSRWRHPRLRFAYGVDSGRYRIGILGRKTTAYTLRARVVGRAGGSLDATRSGTVEAGETRTYDATVPDDPDEEGGLEPVSDGTPWTTVAGVAGGAALGVGACYLWARR